MLVFSPTSRKSPPLAHSGTLVSVRIHSFCLFVATTAFALGLSGGARARLARFAPDIVHIATPGLHGIPNSGDGPCPKGYQSFHRTIHTLGPISSISTATTAFTAYQHLKMPLAVHSAGSTANCSHVYVPTASLVTELRSQGVRRGLRIWSRGSGYQPLQPGARAASPGCGRSVLVLPKLW